MLIHPWDMLGGDRVKNYMMAWTVGRCTKIKHLLTCHVMHYAIYHINEWKSTKVINEDSIIYFVVQNKAPMNSLSLSNSLSL